MDELLKQIVQKLDSLEQGQKELQHGQKNLHEKMGGLEQGQKSLHGKVGRLEGKRESVGDQLDSFEKRIVSQVKHREHRLEAFEVKKGTRQREIQAHIHTLERVVSSNVNESALLKKAA